MTGRSPVGAARAVGVRGEQALVVIRAGRATPPLVCVHAEAGHLRVYENLPRHLDPDQAVYGLRGVGDDLPPHAPYRSFEEMAHRYVVELSELDHTGPYVILGECNGGALAYELAQQLEAGGNDVALLALVDSFAPGEPRVARPRSHRLANSARMLGFHVGVVARGDGGRRRAYVTARAGRIASRFAARASARSGPPPAEIERRRAFRQAAGAYRPASYGGRVALFRGARLPWGADSGRDLGWGRLADDLEVTELDAYHGTCLLEPEVARLAPEIERVAVAAVAAVGGAPAFVDQSQRSELDRGAQSAGV